MIANNRFILTMFIPVVIGLVLTGDFKHPAIIAIRLVAWISAMVLGLLGGWIYTPFVFAVFAAYNLRKFFMLPQVINFVEGSKNSDAVLTTSQPPRQLYSPETIDQLMSTTVYCTCNIIHSKGADFCIECGNQINKGYSGQTISLPPFQ